uniref:Uncharacterized protein n=1 Tax=Lotharella oceanica TaxID=641309 RepID=A0A7S2TFP3_9EUKA|mmetsp:Transcript_11943/g.23007  ORF Transcript_11943/g.23007 Transcript_11943/m.23007 type:complete len:165 (+) Transcript_11943:1203-1697(+)
MGPWEKWTKKPKRTRFSEPGNHPSDFPSTFSSAPVTWDYYGVDCPLQFHAGLFAVEQDNDGFLCPQLGWVVTHDKPLSPKDQLAKLQKQLVDLEKFDLAMANEEEADTQKRFIRRVRAQIAFIQGGGLNIPARRDEMPHGTWHQRRYWKAAKYGRGRQTLRERD